LEMGRWLKKGVVVVVTVVVVVVGGLVWGRI
jgi:hypothetical protein